MHLNRLAKLHYFGQINFILLRQGGSGTPQYILLKWKKKTQNSLDELYVMSWQHWCQLDTHRHSICLQLAHSIVGIPFICMYLGTG